MRIFRHYVGFPIVLLALIEGGLFLSSLYILGLASPCSGCGVTPLAAYFDQIAQFRFIEALFATGAFLTVCAAAGMYNRDSFLDFRQFARRFALASQLVLIPTVAAVTIVKAVGGLPFGWYLGLLSLAIAGFFLLLFVIRGVLFWWFDFEFFKRRVLIFGQGPLADIVSKYVSNEGSSHMSCVGQLAHRRAPQASPFSIGNVVVRPQLFPRPAPFAMLAQSHQAEEIVVATEDRRGLPIEELLECRLHGIQVTDYLSFWEREAGQIDINQVGAGWLAFAEGFRVNLSRRAAKRFFDIVVSLAFLAVTFPVVLLFALLIKLDSKGPVLYRQERVGLNGRVFNILKLRSMRVEAEGDGVPRWASQDDDRITRIGHIIRKTRIDEIPQVINVLTGDMSFIGPRPERPFFVEQLKKEISFYDLRHRVRPGITGWAQVNYRYGASAEDAKKKLAYDLYYVKNGDTILDLAILVQTVRVIFFAHGSR